MVTDKNRKAEERSFRHVGIGVPSIEVLKKAVEDLIENGAVIVRKNDDDTKFFLKLNPEDTTELELFLEDKGLASIHFDKSVADLEKISLRELNTCSVPDMFFSPISEISVETFVIEMAFFKELFDWALWIPRIEKAYKENDVLNIHIPPEEANRLKEENMKSLKDKLSPGAAERLFLVGESDNPYVIVVRICGCCQNC